MSGPILRLHLSINSPPRHISLGQPVAGRFRPPDLLAYISALFPSPNFRENYAEQLRRDFPRIVPPRTTEQFLRMAQLGTELIGAHLLRDRDCPVAPSPSLSRSPSISTFRA